MLGWEVGRGVEVAAALVLCVKVLLLLSDTNCLVFLFSLQNDNDTLCVIPKFTASIQVMTHSHLLSRDELDHVSDTLPLDQSHIHAFSLQEFDTELDFSNKVRYVQSELSPYH